MNPTTATIRTEAESSRLTNENKVNAVALCCYANTGLCILITLYFFLMPFVLMVYYLADPALKEGGIPRFAIAIHRNISPKYERWAAERIKSGRPAELSLADIAGTEWPVFGSFFYLLATEGIQK